MSSSSAVALVPACLMPREQICERVLLYFLEQDPLILQTTIFLFLFSMVLCATCCLEAGEQHKIHSAAHREPAVQKLNQNSPERLSFCAQSFHMTSPLALAPQGGLLILCKHRDIRPEIGMIRMISNCPFHLTKTMLNYEPLELSLTCIIHYKHRMIPVMK